MVISSAAEPSEIWREFPAVMSPSSLKARLERGHLLQGAAAADALVGVEDRAVGVGDRGDLALEPPSSIPAAALACESRACSSSWVRPRPHRSAIISAPMPWLKRTPAVALGGHRAERLAEPSRRRGPSRAGTRLIISRRRRRDVVLPEITPAAAKCTACCEEPHCRSTVTARPEHRALTSGREPPVVPDRSASRGAHPHPHRRPSHARHATSAKRSNAPTMGGTA